MTRENFIDKWLGNVRLNEYTEEKKDLMREDLDSVIDYHQEQVNSVDLADAVGRSEQLPCDCNKHPTYFDKENKPRCKKCNKRSWLAR